VNPQAFRNPYLCLTIVCLLGAIAIISLVGIIVLAAFNKEPPGALISIASGSMCSLGTFLVSPPRGSVGYDESHQQQISQPVTQSVIATPAHTRPQTEEGPSANHS
jgi:hypothetical protein